MNKVIPVPPELQAAVLSLATERDTLKTALEKVHSWLVCWPIATPEDMAQSFDEMEKMIGRAIRR